jgi:hypothetical protein
VVIVEGRNGRVISVTPDGTVQHVAGRSAIEECTSRIPALSPDPGTGDRSLEGGPG